MLYAICFISQSLLNYTLKMIGLAREIPNETGPPLIMKSLKVQLMSVSDNFTD